MALCIAAIVSIPQPVHGQDEEEQVSVPAFSDPIQLVPAGQPYVTAQEPPVMEYYTLAPDFVTDKGFTKGVKFYSEFPQVPDFTSFAKLYDKERCIVYPGKVENFYYFDNSTLGYTYRSNIYDYIHVDPSKLEPYKEYLTKIGFSRINQIEQDGFEEYYNVVKEELLYDPDFKLDKNGVFVVFDGVSDFLWLLIGRSYNYDSENELVECIEFRFYSLKHVPWDKQPLEYFIPGTSTDVASRLRSFKAQTGVTVYGTLPDGSTFILPPSQSGITVSPELPSSESFVQPPSEDNVNSGSDFLNRLQNQLKNDSIKVP